MKIAYAELAIQLEGCAAASDATLQLHDAARPNEASAREITEANWHRIAGSRLRRMERMVRNRWHLFIIFTLTVVIEPLRWLTRRLMHYSSRSFTIKMALGPNGSPP